MRQAFRSFRPASKALTASATCTINKPSSISLVGKVGGIVPNSCHESLEPSGSFNFNTLYPSWWLVVSQMLANPRRATVQASPVLPDQREVSGRATDRNWRVETRQRSALWKILLCLKSEQS
jgi:hypothetical protein